MKTRLQLIIATVFLFSAAAVKAQCTAGFTSSQTQSNIVDFTNTSTPIIPNSTMFWWDFGDSQYGYTQSPSHTYNAPGTYYVCLNMVDSLSMCQSQFCDTVTVWGSVFCNISVNTYANAASCQTCNDGSMYAVPSGGTPPYTYAWSNGATTQSVSGVIPGTYTVCVTDANNCSQCSAVTVSYYNANCQASFTWSQTINNSIDFFSNSTGVTGNTFYYWNYGDNSNGYQVGSNTISHFYNNPGTYMVCLTIMDSTNNCVSSFCDSVTVFGNNITPACDANFVIYPDSVNTQQAWAYNLSTGGAGMTYDWNWGDNTAHDYTAYPSHIYQYTGTYNICLIVNDAANQCSDTMCITINVVRLTPEAMQLPYYVNVVPNGIVSHEITAEWMLSPNPATDHVNLNSNQDLHGRNYRVMDISGRTVLTGKMDNNTISVNSLERGAYILQMENENGSFSSQRFIKQ